jgi:hypothetical protein
MDLLRQEFNAALAKVESIYGECHERWTVELLARPGKATTDSTTHRAERRLIVSVNAERGEGFLRLDLLHECTHVLNPGTDLKNISFLEEAAAQAISLDPATHGDPEFVSFQREHLKNDSNPEAKRYYDALTDLERLTGNVFSFIKELRSAGRRSLSIDVQPKDITEIIRGAEEIAKRLCNKFYP